MPKSRKDDVVPPVRLVNIYVNCETILIVKVFCQNNIVRGIECIANVAFW